MSKDPNPSPVTDWQPMLTARPVQNRLAELIRGEAGLITVRVPTKKPRWATPPISWIVRPPAFRGLELDALGAEIWGACDGKRTTEEIIVFFARRHTLTFHESRVSVTTYLKMLVQRGALAMAM